MKSWNISCSVDISTMLIIQEYNDADSILVFILFLFTSQYTNTSFLLKPQLFAPFHILSFYSAFRQWYKEEQQRNGLYCAMGHNYFLCMQMPFSVLTACRLVYYNEVLNIQTYSVEANVAFLHSSHKYSILAKNDICRSCTTRKLLLKFCKWTSELKPAATFDHLLCP